MKTLRICFLSFLLVFSASLRAADFNVDASVFANFSYTINGNANNPTITLTRGVTYTFAINAHELHPFQIVDGNGTQYDNGVQNNNISQGTITFTVPTNAPSQLAYRCSFHLFFGGTINIVDPADFNISTPGGAYNYTINGFGSTDPTLTLTRGVTYVFQIDASPEHPFALVSNTTTFDLYDDGVVNNNTSLGRIVFSVPTNAPSTLYYICWYHYFGGVINIVDPPSPPSLMVKVISISVGDSVVTMKSVGTNGWNAIPEFTSNLFNPSWTVVPSFTNTFADGTNTTTFNRLDPICGPNVFLRVKNNQ